ncbi:uncharacterized protein LOC120193619 [Hibiscus syriacus]|uniref:uncharacterized protein LOC120193619 n=1 Tax=Hibiscus syriacus TaxID=106335 RepID=UPI001920F6F9|nr:uncharacterized protein LOC120193619 [Hibiscus syriacus]
MVEQEQVKPFAPDSLVDGTAVEKETISNGEVEFLNNPEPVDFNQGNSKDRSTFKFDNGTTMIYYGGRMVGEGIHFKGKAKPKRTLRRNVTVEIDPEKFLADPGFVIEIISSKGLNISSYTRISGRIDIMNIIKRNVLVKFNCSTTFRLAHSGVGFHGDKCKPELDF